MDSVPPVSRPTSSLSRETPAQNVPRPPTTHPTSTEQESNMTIRPGSVDFQIQQQSNIDLEEARIGFAKRPARPNWQSSYHKAKSVKAHEKAELQVIPEPLPRRPLRLAASRMSKNHPGPSDHPGPEAQNLVPRDEPDTPPSTPPSTPPHGGTDGDAVETPKEIGIEDDSQTTIGITPLHSRALVSQSHSQLQSLQGQHDRRDDPAIVAPDSGGQSSDDPKRSNAGAQMLMLGVPNAGDQTSGSHLSQCSDPHSAGNMPPYGGGDTRTATALVANQSVSFMPGGPAFQHSSNEPASFTPGSGGFGARVHPSPFAHQPYHLTQHPPPSSAPKIGMPTPTPARAVDNRQGPPFHQHPQATAQQGFSAPAYQSISDDVHMRDTYHQRLQEDTDMDGGVHQHSQTQPTDSTYQDVPPPTFHGIGQRSLPRVPFPQPTRLGLQSVLSSNRIDGTPGRAGRASHYQSMVPGTVYPGSQLIPSQQIMHHADSFGRSASQYQSTVPGTAYPGSQTIPLQQSTHRTDHFGSGSASQYQYMAQGTANPGSQTVPSQQGTHRTDHFGSGSASQHQPRVPETANPRSQTVPSGSQQGTHHFGSGSASQHQSRVPETANPRSQTVPSGSQQATTWPDASSAQAINLFTQRMSELINTVNTTNSRHQEDMKRLLGEMRSQREGVANRNIEKNTTQKNPPSNTSAKSSSDARRHRRPRRKRHDPYRNEPNHLRFRQCIEKHLLHMLKIKDYSCIDRLPPPLSDEEILAFKRSEPDCITITSSQFRIDLSRSRGHPFNVEAIRVFAENFKHKVITAKWYSFPTPPPRKYLTLEYIELCLFLHLHHVMEVYRNSKRSYPEQQNKLKNASRSMRKTRLFQSRLDCVADDDELVVHNDLVQLMTSAAMSSDESDTDDPSPRKSYRIIAPAWRSKELSDFLHSIDDTILLNRMPRVGHRAIRGAEPRWRKHTDLVNEASVAPPELPYNCYDSDWLASLRRGERNLLQAQENKRYDFLTGAIEYLSEASCEDEPEDEPEDESDDPGSTSGMASGMEDEPSEN